MVEELDLEQVDERELNARLQALTNQGRQVILRHSHARHNIVVNISGAVEILVDGSAGFYCCGFMNGPTVTVTGNVGWYAADNMLGGTLIVQGSAGNNLGSSMIGGTAVVRGTAGSRVGYGLKGGTVMVCGDVGSLTGQQMLGGRIVLLGKVGHSAGEAMYGGAIFYRRGAVAGLGGNVISRAPLPEEAESLALLVAEHDLPVDLAEFECLVPKSGKQKFGKLKPHLTEREEATLST